MIPAYLLSACADRTSDLCRGCAEAVKRNPATGRWFITMGHPGFNSEANNGSGYLTSAVASFAMRAFTRRGRAMNRSRRSAGR